MSSKTGYYRMQIWMVDIKKTDDNIIYGKHPSLIISNWKQCIKSNYLNIIPISSNLTKYISTQILLDGFGLKEKSKILPDQVLTVNKDSLLFKIGKIDNIDKVTEIEQALKVQMQLDKKYKTIDLENLVKNKNSKMDYRLYKNNIVETCILKKHNESIALCNDLLNLTNEESVMWFCYYMISLNNLKLKNHEVSFENCKIAFKYLDTANIINYNINMMLLATCYLNNNKQREAMEIYYRLVEYAKKCDSFSLRVTNLFNICRLRKDIPKMTRLSNIFEKHKFDDRDFKWNKDFNKEEVLKNMKMELEQAL